MQDMRTGEASCLHCKCHESVYGVIGTDSLPKKLCRRLITVPPECPGR
jgi:Rieske Fe-S protein